MFDAAERGIIRRISDNLVSELSEDLWSPDQMLKSPRNLAVGEDAFFGNDQFSFSTAGLHQEEKPVLAQAPRNGEPTSFVKEHPLTKTELAGLADVSNSAKFLESARKEINQFGTKPEDALLKLVKDHRVLALSEFHRSPNAMRDLATSIIPNLKKAGATHLALEMPESLQTNLDTFMKTGELDRKSLPGGLQDDDYIQMLETARIHGLKLVAIDTDSQEERDENMANRLQGILRENASNKIMFLAGAGHIQCTEDNAKTAIEYLKQSGELQITTVFAELPELSNRLNTLLPDLSRPVCLSTKQSANVGSINTFGPWFKEKYRDFDHVIIFPVKKSGQ